MDTLLKDLDWENLASRCKDARCTLMHKIMERRVAVEEDLRPPISKNMLRSTSQRRLEHCKSNTAPHRESFFPRTIRDWNTLHPTARTASTLEVFKGALHLK